MYVSCGVLPSATRAPALDLRARELQPMTKHRKHASETDTNRSFMVCLSLKTVLVLNIKRASAERVFNQSSARRRRVLVFRRLGMDVMIDAASKACQTFSTSAFKFQKRKVCPV